MDQLQRIIETGVPPETARELVRSFQQQALAAAREMLMDRDTSGEEVPTWLAHAYTYDSSGNLKTDTVTQGDVSWVRTYTWDNGVQTGDSGWVRQDGGQ